jgi:hypothetical protein
MDVVSDGPDESGDALMRVVRLRQPHRLCSTFERRAYESEGPAESLVHDDLAVVLLQGDGVIRPSRQMIHSGTKRFPRPLTRRLARIERISYCERR